MTTKQHSQTIHWLNEFTKMANLFWQNGNKENYEYWKGQVMGMCKVIPFMTEEIDTDYYLNQLL